MQNRFFEAPILNSPYEYPAKHWALDNKGLPTQQVNDSRRLAKFVSPIPNPQKRKGDVKTKDALDNAALSDEQQRYAHAEIINTLRFEVDKWRVLPEQAWRVTPETARLLKHWRSYEFAGVRPFFCQIEAVEVAIWLVEVAPVSGANGQRFLTHMKDANAGANPGLLRLALKLATGAGKTTVMAMLMAWQTINAQRYKTNKKFSRGFLVVAPGLTIKDRLQVLQPNDADSYFKTRELAPADLLRDLESARIVITNYHAFKLRERVEISKGGKQLLQGQGGEPISTLETEGQMLQRVLAPLMAMKNIVVMNDEAHHCYRAKPQDDAKAVLSAEERKEANDNNEAARLWISGPEALQRKIGIAHVFDLSATPFFLRGSGFIEGTLFPWTMSDFSLMDAIECGIVKLPRVPIADNIPGAEMPVYRDLWANISKEMPKAGRGKGASNDPAALPAKFVTALSALYTHYSRTFDAWAQAGIDVPPCFIVVCNNTSTSKLIYDYIAGFEQRLSDGSLQLSTGASRCFAITMKTISPMPGRARC